MSIAKGNMVIKVRKIGNTNQLKRKIKEKYTKSLKTQCLKNSICQNLITPKLIFIW